MLRSFLSFWAVYPIDTLLLYVMNLITYQFSFAGQLIMKLIKHSSSCFLWISTEFRTVTNALDENVLESEYIDTLSAIHCLCRVQRGVRILCINAIRRFCLVNVDLSEVCITCVFQIKNKTKKIVIVIALWTKYNPLYSSLCFWISEPLVMKYHVMSFWFLLSRMFSDTAVFLCAEPK